jgi:hypothetical protein
MHATATPKLVDQQPAFLAVLATLLFAAGIALGAALPGLDLKIAPSAAVSVPDNSYNAVEGIRAQFGVAPDTSYDTVESIRAQAGVKAAPTTKVGKSGFPSTRGRGISAHDKARGFGGWWASAAAGTAAGTPVSQAESNDRYGSGIR